MIHFNYNFNQIVHLKYFNVYFEILLLCSYAQIVVNHTIFIDW